MHQVYTKLRPYLYKVGVLQLARKLVSKRLRTQIASWFGLDGVDLYHNYERYLPPREQPSPVVFDGLNFFADFEVALGTGEAARQLRQAIQTTDISLATVQIDLGFKVTQTTDLSPKECPYHIHLVHINPPEIPHAMELILNQVVSDRYLIAYWHWELGHFPKKWATLANYFDEIWVASNFIKNQLQTQFPNTPVKRVALPVNISTSREDSSLWQNRFVFLTTFSPTSNVARKNPFGTIEAFRRAFADDVTPPLLVVKTHHLDSDYGRLVKEPLQEAVAQVNGVLIEDTLEREAVAQLFARCNCLVSLHRAEGFGFPIAEAMALGKPVICTGYSGNMDFTHPDNSFLVDFHLRAITEEDHVYYPPMRRVYPIGEIWAEPNLDHAAQLMRRVYDDPAMAQLAGQQGQQTILTEYSHQHIGRVIQQRLNEL